ncbi:MAG: hypothetical protein OMM_03821 [Candidatus Magnetoglobus multicellularis str. Araruama]|uniref:TIR domain-containing protein n=1 Tax=Candidatus Magnetoglobus multicellularis str. Araruama TaxID=890399 RepID=A0A1V1P3Y6_9BACT|nr:MAG: hypothetical protein OMM_03821 [Candidatus Magnetoglobus multicellularis str. Araruama]
MIQEDSDHFYNLEEKLDIYKGLFFKIAFNDIRHSPIDKGQAWLRQYGLVKNLNGKAVILNSIYKKRFCSPELIQQYKQESSRPKPMIFLCHAKEDNEYARLLHEKLKDADLNPWLDEINILPGQNWDYEIQHAMKKADFALIILSELSVKKRGYINKEIKWALDRQSEKQNGDIFLIPVKIESCDLPDNLSNFQAVNLEVDEFEQIIISLNFQIKKQGFDMQPAITIINK